MSEAALTLDVITRAQRLKISERIEAPRLILIASDASHAEETFEAAWESRDELRPWMPWAYPEPTLAGTSQWHAKTRMHWFQRDMFDFQIYEKSSGRLVGKCGFHHIKWALPRFEIGYWIRTSAQKQGYCTEAVQTLIQLAREEMGANRLEICSDPRNVPSRRVAERCGFTLEGILKQNMRAPDGSLRDSCVYALVFA
jgi:RimJ/RimL family protein N-acetyltransferase